MKKGSRIVRVLFVALLALCIPGALAIGGMRSRKYADLNKDVTDLETRQQTLVDENKNLITDISLLSSTDRIERIAEEERRKNSFWNKTLRGLKNFGKTLVEPDDE
jgi:cell division protein FtsL